MQSYFFLEIYKATGGLLGEFGPYSNYYEALALATQCEFESLLRASFRYCAGYRIKIVERTPLQKGWEFIQQHLEVLAS